MEYSRRYVSIAACAICVLVTVPVSAGLVQVGSTYQVRGTNFPVDFALTNVTLDASTHSLAGGLLNVRADIINVDVDSAWLLFYFFTPSGDSIAGNVNRRWDFLIEDIPFADTAQLSAVFYQWTIDGVGVSNIQNWAGGGLFPPDGSNPFNAALGPGYGAVVDPPEDPFSDFSLFINPFSFISTSVIGGVDPNAINGFRAAFLVTRDEPIAAVPEPSSLAIYSILGLVGLVAKRHRRRRWLLAAG